MLENDSILLRAVEPEDIDFLYRCENDTDLWRYGTTIVPYSRYAIKQYIAETQNDIYTDRQLRLIITRKDKGEAVGAVDLFDFDPFHLRAAVGIAIVGDENRRLGFASQTLQLLVDYSFDFLHLHQLYCTVAADNVPSLHIFEKAGFERCGLRKEWIKTADGFADVVEMQLVNRSGKE
ncbi:MAG: GNAT family N-acetyltransferase [Salinivirgaceae bacterium]|nr:GNAT family N-acetyltransferase [Salinivirgaceae bacterium]